MREIEAEYQQQLLASDRQYEAAVRAAGERRRQSIAVATNLRAVAIEQARDEEKVLV